jgi:hypothetical protein
VTVAAVESSSIHRLEDDSVIEGSLVSSATPLKIGDDRIQLLSELLRVQRLLNAMLLSESVQSGVEIIHVHSAASYNAPFGDKGAYGIGCDRHLARMRPTDSRTLESSA